MRLEYFLLGIGAGFHGLCGILSQWHINIGCVCIGRCQDGYARFPNTCRDTCICQQRSRFSYGGPDIVSLLPFFLLVSFRKLVPCSMPSSPPLPALGTRPVWLPLPRGKAASLLRRFEPLT